MKKMIIDETTIYAPRFFRLKKILDRTDDNGDILDVSDLLLLDKSMVVRALFLATKESRYRKNVLDALTFMAGSYSPESVIGFLKTRPDEQYRINSGDISKHKRDTIIKFLFKYLTHKTFRFAAVFLIGFFLAPSCIPLLEKFSKDKNPLIRKEAEYSLDFIRDKMKQP
ncbi:MAG: HEAT repeat domain-containing protein [Candidatus Gracilibacteria bacterium]|jgi:hypothetical protein